MKAYFVCSLIHKGVLGGGLILEDESLRYRTNKVTVDRKLRDLEMRYQDIASLDWREGFLPVASVRMKNGECYRFLIFGKRRFQKIYEETKGELKNEI